MRTRRVLWLICLALPVIVLGGCGANQSQSADLAAVQPAGDVLLFVGDTVTEEAWSRSGVKATVPGIALKTNGHFYQRVVNEGDTKTHSFTTNAGVCYQVSAVGLRQGDDIDLAISRDPNPGVNGWKYSMRPPPKWEGFVFRSSQDGTMYVGAHGHYSGAHDGTVEYAIHVRKCQFGTFTKSQSGGE